MLTKTGEAEPVIFLNLKALISQEKSANSILASCFNFRHAFNPAG
jgi:hypothetical protein